MSSSGRVASVIDNCTDPGRRGGKVGVLGGVPEPATGDQWVVGGSQLQTYAGWQAVERWIAVGPCQTGSTFTWYF